MSTKTKQQAQKRERAKQLEDLKREAKKKAARKIAAEPCLYCGRQTLCRDYILNPGAQHELPCCGEECFTKAKAFVAYDARRRIIFYLILLVFVSANLIFWSLNFEMRWKYLPMLGMGISAIVYPLIFTRYERYQKFGIRKTKEIIRAVAGAISAFALLLILIN